MVSDSEPVVPMVNTVTTTEGDLTAESEPVAEKDKDEKQEEQENIDIRGDSCHQSATD